MIEQNKINKELLDGMGKWGLEARKANEAESPLTDEQLQNKAYEFASHRVRQGLLNEGTAAYAGTAAAYIAAATPLQALLKEKEETIVCIERNYQQLLKSYEEMKAFTDKAIKEKDAEIERLKALAKTMQEGVDVYFKQNHEARKQLAELKKENERLKREAQQNWDSLADIKQKYLDSYVPESQKEAAYHFDEITKLLADKMEHYKYYQITGALLRQQLTDLRALHTQQMEEAWDAAELYRSYQGFIENNIKWPIAIPPNKSTYISNQSKTFYMRNYIEEAHEDEMPCVCDCGNVFDLDDGYNSLRKPNIAICESCHEKEETIMGLEEEIQELEDEITNAQYALDNNPKAIQQLKKQIAAL